MDEVYYLPRTINIFLKKNLCADDQILYKYYINNDVEKFRKRLSKMENKDKLINGYVYSITIDICRDIIMKYISKLTDVMLPFGDIVLTGGEAFNNYLPISDRVITSDIDVKFVPQFSPRNKKFFGYLQYAKLFLWNYLGKSCEGLTKEISQRFKLLSKSKPGKFLGVKLVNPVTRRYTLLKKKKSSKNNKVNPSDIFIDVELFSIDINVKYFVPSAGKIKEVHLGGILDIPFMRPGEFGSEISTKKNKGIFIRNPVTGKIQYINNIFVANKEFLITDVYFMHTLGLRPNKIEKDRKRIYVFSKNVLGLKNISSKTSMSNILKKIQRYNFKTPPAIVKTRPNFKLSDIKKINPYKYEKYTTEPQIGRLLHQFVINSSVNLPNFNSTNANYMFNANSKKWKITNNPFYVKNTKKFRPVSGKYKIKTPIVLSNTLYSYDNSRDSWIDKDIILKSSMIPFVGLKNKYVTIIKK